MASKESLVSSRWVVPGEGKAKDKTERAAESQPTERRVQLLYKVSRQFLD